MANADKMRDAIAMTIVEAQETGQIDLKIPANEAKVLADIIIEALEEQGLLD